MLARNWASDRRYSHLDYDFPGCRTIDAYQKMFFTMPSRNLPFIHESTPIVENAPGKSMMFLLHLRKRHVKPAEAAPRTAKAIAKISWWRFELGKQAF